MKKIEFIPDSDHTAKALNPPAPSKGFIPQWYKDSTNYLNGNTLDYVDNIDQLKNYKLCIPFLDSMMAGYMVELPYDVYVQILGDKIHFNWPNEEKLIIPRRNLKGMPRPAGCLEQAYAWTFFWGVKTPPGYSVLVTHPFNRHDLPFITTSGIMDSDGFSQGGEIPFFLKENVDGLIPAGTPIAQIFPFKREDWKSEKREYDDSFNKKQKYQAVRHLTGAYKKLWWARKKFE